MYQRMSICKSCTHLCINYAQNKMKSYTTIIQMNMHRSSSDGKYNNEFNAMLKLAK